VTDCVDGCDVSANDIALRSASAADKLFDTFQHIVMFSIAQRKLLEHKPCKGAIP
jgi:hypothetical protein